MNRTHSAHFPATYWAKVDAAWVTAKSQMETELANVQRRDEQRQGPYVFPAQPNEWPQYQDRGETAQ